MQTVIELVKIIREQKKLLLNVSLNKVIIVHSDKQYRDDIKSLESYLEETVNIRNVIVTSDEKKYGIKYELLPNSTFDNKFKKDKRKIRMALPNVTSEMINVFSKTNLLEIKGFVLTNEDVSVTMKFDNSNKDYHVQTIPGLIVIVDTSIVDTS